MNVMNADDRTTYTHSHKGGKNNTTIFSRSYCYTVWSAIGVILLSVCLLSVTLCILTLRVGVRG